MTCSCFQLVVERSCFPSKIIIIMILIGGDRLFHMTGAGGFDRLMSIDELCAEPYPDPRPVHRYDLDLMRNCIEAGVVIDYVDTDPTELLGLYSLKDLIPGEIIIDLGPYTVTHWKLCNLLRSSLVPAQGARPSHLRPRGRRRHLHEFVSSHMFKGMHLTDPRNKNNQYVDLTAIKSPVLFLNSAMEDDGTEGNTEFQHARNRSLLVASSPVKTYEQLLGAYLQAPTQAEIG